MKYTCIFRSNESHRHLLIRLNELAMYKTYLSVALSTDDHVIYEKTRKEVGWGGI